MSRASIAVRIRHWEAGRNARRDSTLEILNAVRAVLGLKVELHWDDTGNSPEAMRAKALLRNQLHPQQRRPGSRRYLREQRKAATNAAAR